MKKRILAFVLAICMVFCAMPMEAKAYTGDIPGVDYTRIEYNTTYQKDVQFVIGPNRFTGKLSNGQNIDEDLVDDIIRQVMKENNVTSEKLKKSHQLESQALEFNEKMYTYPRIFLEMFLNLAGLGSSEELSMLLTGDGDKIKVDTLFVLTTIRDTAMNKLFDIVMTYGTGKPIATLLGALKDNGTMAIRELKQYYAGNEKAQQAFAAALALEEFYAVCNARIKEEEKKQGKEGTWRLTCLEQIDTEVTLFERITVPQYWKLAVDLTRTSAASDDPSDWGGTYEGVVQLNINHMMQKFDTQFKEQVFLSSALPFNKYSSYYIITDQYSAPSVLKKQLRNGNFKIQISSKEAKNGQLNKEFTLNGFEDNSDFWSYHPIHMGVEYALMHDGVMDISGGGVHSHTEVLGTYKFMGDMSGDAMGIGIDMYQYDWHGSNTTSVPVIGTFHNEGGHSGSGSSAVMTDNTVFKDILGKKEIVIGGIE